MTDVATALRALQQVIVDGAPLPENDRQLLAAKVASGDLKLDQAYRRRGGPSVRRKWALNERDGLLSALWRSHPAYRNHPPAAAAALMAIDASRYESDRWPRERNSVDAPGAEPAATFWRCLRLEVAIPRSEHLADVLTKDF